LLAVAILLLIAGIIVLLAVPGASDTFVGWFKPSDDGDQISDDELADRIEAPADARAPGRALPGAISASPVDIGSAPTNAPVANARAIGDAATAARFISMDTQTILTSPPSGTGDRLSRIAAAGEFIAFGAPGKGRVYVFRAVTSGWEQMSMRDRPNGFGAALAAHGSKLYVADAAAVTAWSLPDLAPIGAAVVLQDGERLVDAVAAGPVICSTEAVRVGTREIFRGMNAINRVRALADGSLAVCTAVNTVFMSADGSIQKTLQIPSLDVVAISTTLTAISRYDEETVVICDSSGAEKSRVSLPGGSDRPTGYGQTLAVFNGHLAVSAPYDNVNTAVETGSVFLYRIAGTDVYVHDMLNTPEKVENAHFGEHMATFNNKLLVSSERIAGNAGRISVFAG
jgi:hypothetical protein